MSSRVLSSIPTSDGPAGRTSGYGTFTVTASSISPGVTAETWSVLVPFTVRLEMSACQVRPAAMAEVSTSALLTNRRKPVTPWAGVTYNRPWPAKPVKL